MTDPTDVLVKFEKDNIPAYYQEYYSNKRHNLFATIQQFPSLVHCYFSLDEIWLREFECMQTLKDPNLMFPLTLYMSGHAKMRIAFELGGSACLAEARSILRDAIEATAHGHRLALHPELGTVWLKKDDDAQSFMVYKQEFEEHKEQRLFEGLNELYRMWKRFSELGSHTNINAIAERFGTETTATHLQFKCNYTGSKPGILAPALFEMILAFNLMEAALFRVCEGRLRLDIRIPEMRKYSTAKRREFATKS